MNRLLLLLLIFSSPVITETNNLDKTFLEITMNCRTYRIFDSACLKENEKIFSTYVKDLSIYQIPFSNLEGELKKIFN